MVDINPRKPAGPIQYPPGVYSTPPAQQQGLPPYYPAPAGQSSGNPANPSPAPTGPNPMAPGSDVYDWYAINEALRASNMGDGSWQIAGASHQPVRSGSWVPNPSYDKSSTPEENIADGNGEEFVFRPGSDYVIGVVNNKTGQLVKVHLTKSTPDAQGHYTYGVVGREDQGKLDNANPGYTSPQQLEFSDGHKELWGTNTQTGAFEKMPGSPPNLGNTKGWSDIKQIETTDASGRRVKAWVGTNPQGEPFQPVPGAPAALPIDKYVPGSVKQVTKNGKQVYVGQNAQTQQWEDIPELGSEAVTPKTTTAGGNVYTPNPKAGQPGQPDFVLASGISQPVEGVSDRWVDAGGGNVKHQVYKNGDWQEDPGTPQRPVSPSAIAAAGALKPKGTKYWQPLSGSPDTMIEVTADGNGGFTYEFGPNGEPPPVKKVPGIREPTAVTGGSSGDEFLPQRRDPYTQKLLPPEQNINWQPSLVGDRVRQLQDRARAKQQEIHDQVTSGQLSEDQANKQFLDWWQANIEPAKQEIQIAQNTKAQELNRQNLATAQTSARDVLGAVERNAPPGNSPAYAAALGGVLKATKGAPQGIDYTAALSAPAPNYADVYDQATARALAHISPTAAQKVNGSPTPSALPSLQNTDLTAGLNATNYLYNGAAPGAPARPAPPPAPMPTPAQATPMPYVPTGQPAQMTPMPYIPTGQPVNFDLLMQRIRDDQAQQQLQAQAWPAYQPAF